MRAALCENSTVCPRHPCAPCRLLDFCFLEFNVLFCNGIILAERQLFSLRARILLCGIEKPCIRCRQQFDLYSGSLGHCRTFPDAPVPASRAGRMSCRVIMKLLKRGIAQAACIVKISTTRPTASHTATACRACTDMLQVVAVRTGPGHQGWFPAAGVSVL